MLFDTDQMDGTENAHLRAQSVLRFVIIFVGAVFVADSMGFDLTSSSPVWVFRICSPWRPRSIRTSLVPSRSCSTVPSRWVIDQRWAAEGEVIEINLNNAD